MGAEDNLGTTQRRASVKWIGSINATILINMYPCNSQSILMATSMISYKHLFWGWECDHPDKHISLSFLFPFFCFKLSNHTANSDPSRENSILGNVLQLLIQRCDNITEMCFSNFLWYCSKICMAFEWMGK